MTIPLLLSNAGFRTDKDIASAKELSDFKSYALIDRLGFQTQNIDEAHAIVINDRKVRYLYLRSFAHTKNKAKLILNLPIKLIKKEAALFNDWVFTEQEKK